MICFVFETPEEEHKFHSLYEKYHRVLYKQAIEILRNQHDAEDAVQMALEKIYNYFYKIKDESEKRCLGYMIVVVRNIAIDIYNSKKRDLPMEEEKYLFDNISQYSEVSLKQEFEDLRDAIKRIDKKYSDILILKYVYGYSLKEIAGMLNISETNVSTRLNRGKNYIKKLLNQEERVHDER